MNNQYPSGYPPVYQQKPFLEERFDMSKSYPPGYPPKLNSQYGPFQHCVSPMMTNPNMSNYPVSPLITNSLVSPIMSNYSMGHMMPNYPMSPLMANPLVNPMISNYPLSPRMSNYPVSPIMTNPSIFYSQNHLDSGIIIIQTPRSLAEGLITQRDTPESETKEIPKRKIPEMELIQESPESETKEIPKRKIPEMELKQEFNQTITIQKPPLMERRYKNKTITPVKSDCIIF